MTCRVHLIIVADKLTHAERLLLILCVYRDSISGSGRSPGVGNDNPLWYHPVSWKIPWTEEPGRLKSLGSQRVGHDRAHPHTHSILGREGGQKGGVDAEVWAVCWWHLVVFEWAPGLGSGTLPASPLWLCSLGSWKHWPPLSSQRGACCHMAVTSAGLEPGWNPGESSQACLQGPLRGSCSPAHIPGWRLPRSAARSLSALTWVTGFPLPGQTGGGYMCLVPLHLSAILLASDACLALLLTSQKEWSGREKARGVSESGCGCSPRTSLQFWKKERNNKMACRENLEKRDGNSLLASAYYTPGTFHKRSFKSLATKHSEIRKIDKGLPKITLKPWARTKI